MARNRLNYVFWKIHAEVAANLKGNSQAATADGAEQRLVEFGDKWEAGEGCNRAISQP